MRRPQPRLWLKLALTLLLLELVLGAVLLVVGLDAHEKTLLHHGQRRADTIGRLLNASLAPALVQMDYVHAGELLEETHRQERLDYLLLADPRGQPLAAVGIGHDTPLPAADAALGFDLNDQRYDFSVPIGLLGETYGRVFIGFPTTHEVTLRTLWLTESLAYSAFILLVSLIVFLLLGLYFSRPIQALALASDRVAAGELGVRVNPHGRDELGHLGAAFNRMAEALDQRQRIERERQALARQNSLILASAGEGIFGIDRDGNHTFVNPAAARMLGYAPGELHGRPSHATWHHHRPDGAPFPEQECSIHGTLRGGGAHKGEEWFIRKDGSFFPVSYYCTPIEAEGKITGAVVSFTDITEGLKSAQELRLAATVFKHSGESIVVTDVAGNLLTVNPAFTAMTGYTAEEVLGQSLHFLNSNRHDHHSFAAMWSELKQNGTWQGEIWNRRKDGSVYPELLTASAVRGEDGVTTHYVGVSTDLSDIKRIQERLDYVDQHDALTNLPNLQLLSELVNHAIRTAARQELRIALLFLDLDHFKHINESLGHGVGDQLLVGVARRLEKFLRGFDTLARSGGDEFIVLTEQLEKPDEAGSLAQRLINALHEPFIVQEHTLYLGTSVGIAIYPEDGADMATLQKNADTALYLAKEAGRNTFRYFSPELADAAQERLALEMLLRHALERGELELHYQPQVDLATGDVIGMEALARWSSPALGPISPVRFIPLAEETGVIVPLGDWALRTACLQMRQWIAEGRGPGYVAVNVSAVQFVRGDLYASVAAAIEESGIEPERLELEITESSVLNDPETVVTILNRLKVLGVRIAIDDFGTGYSSLSYLKRLPVARLKIDQGFVRDMLTDSNDEAIVRAVIALGQSLGMDVLAEGVETLAHAERLLELGCDAAQGWHYGRPERHGGLEAPDTAPRSA